MFDRQRYRWHRWRIDRRHAKGLKAANKKHDQREVQSIVADAMSDIQLLDEEVNFRESWRLRNEATFLDVETPPMSEDVDVWTYTNDGRRFLTAKSRADLRKQIDAEKTRRREVKAWWWKTILAPALTALVGIIGALIGLVAALKK
jgi:hypothetical protein